ncbi:hypothetical protein [Campylobacter helveticus]|uniref:hypothetical protein n=1 Tax=Campylobacter helveticus TaxID=28898 RepID=UPI00104609CA|nr:hypothetical protein [Campylobacter helveticus]QBL12725.1 hypothetical protein A0073_09860 [Campylobacter helveticus]
MNKKIKQYWKRNYKTISSWFQIIAFAVCLLLSSYAFTDPSFEKLTVEQITKNVTCALIFMAISFSLFLFFTYGDKNQKILELLKTYSSSVCVIIIMFYYFVEKYEDHLKTNNDMAEVLSLPYKFFWILTIFMTFYLIRVAFFNDKNDDNSA